MKNINDELDTKVKEALVTIKEQYLDDNNIPWLIGYSGGKDSSCTAQLVFRAVKELKEDGVELIRKVNIFSSDTMIENPLVKAIVDKNMELINAEAKRLGLPIKAFILKPRINNSFWVNIIGKGYPTPNTMFRWCTDRLKIAPANDFVKKYIDEDGEVIMVLGVRGGESNTRDRVLKQHSVNGKRLMKHTTLTNAYVFPPIINFNTKDVFSFLSSYESPWGSSNKELYFFYEESGGVECPIFLSKNDKSSSNACGNSRLGCWCCTVVSEDKSLTGFINTGWYDELTPLLQFRNWLVSIRDDDKYRNFYRMSGKVYTKKIEVKTDKIGKYLSIPRKGSRQKIEIRISEEGEIIGGSDYFIVEKDELSNYLKEKGLTFKSQELSKIILIDRITKEYYKIGVGSFNDEAKKLIFYKLIETEHEYNKRSKNRCKLITDKEIDEIKKKWIKSSMDIEYIDNTLEKFGRKKVTFIQDAFELNTRNYEGLLKEILQKRGLDYETLNKLVRQEREAISKANKDEMQAYIEEALNSDKVNFES